MPPKSKAAKKAAQRRVKPSEADAAAEAAAAAAQVEAAASAASAVASALRAAKEKGGYAAVRALVQIADGRLPQGADDDDDDDDEFFAAAAAEWSSALEDSPALPMYGGKPFPPLSSPSSGDEAAVVHYWGPLQAPLSRESMRLLAFVSSFLSGAPGGNPNGISFLMPLPVRSGSRRISALVFVRHTLEGPALPLESAVGIVNDYLVLDWMRMSSDRSSPYVAEGSSQCRLFDEWSPPPLPRTSGEAPPLSLHVAAANLACELAWALRGPGRASDGAAAAIPAPALDAAAEALGLPPPIAAPPVSAGRAQTPAPQAVADAAVAALAMLRERGVPGVPPLSSSPTTPEQLLPLAYRYLGSHRRLVACFKTLDDQKRQKAMAGQR